MKNFAKIQMLFNGPRTLTVFFWHLLQALLNCRQVLYTVEHALNGTFFVQMDVKVDNLIYLPDGVIKTVCDEIEEFWKRGPVFTQYGFLHRRGYLFYGVAGGGKTATVQLICQRVIDRGDVVLVCQQPQVLKDALILFRKIEPNRRVVCVFEDIDAIDCKNAW